MSVASHYQKYHVASHFSCLDLRNAVVSFFMPSASWDTDISARGITWPKCQVAPHFICLDIRNAMVSFHTSGIMWCNTGANGITWPKGQVTPSIDYLELTNETVSRQLIFNRTLVGIVDKLLSRQLVDFIRSEGKGDILYYILALRCSMHILRCLSMPSMSDCFMYMPIGWNGLSKPTEGCSTCMPIIITNFKARDVEQDSAPYMMNVILTHIPIECGVVGPFCILVP